MTTEERGLLQAVIDEPEDDAPRLVYADWLDEHGRPERAEFIRVECARARIRIGSEEYDRTAGQLQRRAYELQKEHEKAWVAEVGLPANRHTYCWFRRGMVARLWCTVRYFLDHGEKALAAAPIEAVCFRQATVKNLGQAAASPAFQWVRGVEFQMDETSVEMVGRFLEVVTPGHVRELELDKRTICPSAEGWYTRNVSLGRDIARCAALAGLKRLRLRHMGIGDEGALALAESPHLPGLELLDLQENGIGKATATALRARFGGAVCLGRADYGRFTIGQLWS